MVSHLSEKNVREGGHHGGRVVGLMKRILGIGMTALVLFAAAMLYSVWRESQAPVTHTPGPLETGRAQLHAQLEAAKKTESEAEQHDWNSPERLRAMVQGHEQRIEKLRDNKEAAEIVAYDRDSAARLQRRIAQLAEEQAAKAEATEQAAEDKEEQ